MIDRPTAAERTVESSAALESIHATALVIGESGVLVRGPSGSGKSALSLALLALAGERGLFARLIGDDRAFIRAQNGRVMTTGAPEMRGLIERRGYGIVRAQAEACAIARLVVDILPPHTLCERAPEEEARQARLCGISLPRLTFDDASSPLERAFAVLERLDTAGDKNMSGFAHFA